MKNILNLCRLILQKWRKLQEGRMLVLFTSYEMLKEAYTNLKNDEELEGYLLLTQKCE